MEAISSLQDLYHQLDLPRINKEIQKRHRFNFSLDDILSRLIYGQILAPCSKQIHPTNFKINYSNLQEFELQHFIGLLKLFLMKQSLYKNKPIKLQKR